MTTFQDLPPQSRRAVRESERGERQAASAEYDNFTVPAPEADATPAQNSGEQSDAAAHAPQNPPIVRASGRRAQRAAAQPGLVEVENSDGKSAGTAEPLSYTTQQRSSIPSYDGPGASFAERLRQSATPTPDVLDEPDAPAEPAQQFRVRDFSPEGRRSSGYSSQPTPPAEPAPVDLDYRTQQAPPATPLVEPVETATPSAESTPSAEPVEAPYTPPALVTPPALIEPGEPTQAYVIPQAARSYVPFGSAPVAPTPAPEPAPSAEATPSAEPVEAPQAAAEPTPTPSAEPVEAPAAATPAPQVFMTRRELRAAQAKAEAAAALVEPEPTVADDAALSEAITDFDALARAAEAAQAAPAEPVQAAPAPAAEAAPPTQAFPFSATPAPAAAADVESAPAQDDSLTTNDSAPVIPSLETLLAPDPLTGQTAAQALAPDLSAVPDTSEPRAFQWGIQPENAELPTPVSAADTSDVTSEALEMPRAEEPAPASLTELLAAAPAPVVEPAAEAPAKPERKRNWFGRTKPAVEEPEPEAQPAPVAEAAPVEAPAVETPHVETPQTPAERYAGLATPSVAAAASASVDSSTPAAFNFGLTPAAPVAPETPAAPAADVAPEAPAAAAQTETELNLPSLPVPGPAASDWAAPQNDGLTPAFVEPPATTGSYAAPVGHWSRQLDDEEDVFENTLSREVGGGNVATTTSALILPQIPQADYTTGLSTGETLVTGTIDLPQSFGTMGGDARRYDNPDVDHILDAFDSEVVSTDSAPVRATRAVSTHTSTHGVINSAKPRSGNRLLTVLIVSAGILAVGVVGLLIASFLIK